MKQVTGQVTWRGKCVIVGAISVCGYSAWADVVYQDSFTGSASSFLDSNAPTQSNNSGGEIGTSTPLWMSGNKSPALRHRGIRKQMILKPMAA